MCFENYVNFWFFNIKNWISKENTFKIKNFTDIEENMMIKADLNMTYLKDIINDFENDQSVTMIKMLFCLFIINYLLNNL